MKLFLKIGTLLLVVCTFMFVACKKDEVNQSLESSQDTHQDLLKGISYNGNMLVFDNENTIQLLTEKVLKNPEETNNLLSQRFPSFLSNRKACLDLMSSLNLDNLDDVTARNNSKLIYISTEDGEKILKRVIDSYLLSSISNIDGSFQIGSTIFRITQDMVYQYDPITKRETRKDKIVRSEQNIKKDTRSYEQQETEYSASCRTRKHKVRTRCFYSSYQVYSEAGGSVESTRKNLVGIWVDQSVPTISLQGTYTIDRYQITTIPQALCSSTTFNINSTDSNTYRIQSTGTSCWTCCNSLVLKTYDITGTVLPCSNSGTFSAQVKG